MKKDSKVRIVLEIDGQKLAEILVKNMKKSIKRYKLSHGK